jgi:MarR family transcriptional regulator for hemolysin
MERDGLIRRASDPADGRRMRITLTESARQIQADLARAALDVNEIAGRSFTATERAAFMDMISRAINNLETDRADRPGGG